MVCNKFNLTHSGKPVEQGLKQSGTDAFPLLFRIYQKILNKYDRGAVAHRTKDSQKIPAFIGCQNQQGMFISFPEGSGIFRVCSPSDGRI